MPSLRCIPANRRRPQGSGLRRLRLSGGLQVRRRAGSDRHAESSIPALGLRYLVRQPARTVRRCVVTTTGESVIRLVPQSRRTVILRTRSQRAEAVWHSKSFSTIRGFWTGCAPGRRAVRPLREFCSPRGFCWILGSKGDCRSQLKLPAPSSWRTINPPASRRGKSGRRVRPEHSRKFRRRGWSARMERRPVAAKARWPRPDGTRAPFQLLHQ